jgi:hypothetical protein
MKYLKLFEEIELTLAELDKRRNGKLRGNDLVSKLKENPVKLTIKGKGEQEIAAVKVEDETTGKKVAVVPAVAATKIVNTDGNYDSDKAKKVFKKAPGYRNYDKSLILADGGEEELTKVVKTKDFGSAGPGVFIREYEVVQCLFIAYKLKFPRKSAQDQEAYIKDVLNFWTSYQNGNPAALKRVNIFLDEKVKITTELLNNLASNKDWRSTFIKVPQVLFRYKEMFNPETSYSVFHESNTEPSSPVHRLVNKFNVLKSKCRKCGDTKVFNKVPCECVEKERVKPSTRINFSKFCPADVYIVETNELENLNTAISSCVSMDALVALMDSYFDDNILIPISLKKVKDGLDKFKIIVNKEVGKKLPEFDIKYFRITQDASKGIGSRISTLSKWTEVNNDPKDPDKVEIEKKDRDITFDSSNTGNSVNVDGEVSGSSSRHGKISFTAIKSILDRYRVTYRYDELQKHSELKAKKGESISENLALLRRRISSLYAELIALRDFQNGVDVQEMSTSVPVEKKKNGKGTGTYYTKIIKYTDLSNDDSDNIENKLISKLQSLQILVSIAKIYKISPKISNEVITEIMSYALSIKTGDFETPRYLRII